MSTLGAPGWSAIGRRSALFVFIALVLAVLGIFLIFLCLLFPSLFPILKWPIIILAIIAAIFVFGTVGATLSIWIKDLGHNFYTTWKTGGIRAAWLGLKADVTTCGNAWGKAAKQRLTELAKPLVDGVTRAIGGFRKALGF